MSADLEASLAEAGDLRELVATLRAAPAARAPADLTARVMAQVRATNRRHRFLRRLAEPAVLLPVAACLVAMLAAAALFLRPAPRATVAELLACQRADGSFSASTAAPYVQAFAVTVLARDPTADRQALAHAVEALVRTQDVEGGWAGARLSARNVAALGTAAQAGVASAERAYKRGVRYLRSHGIGALSTADLAQDARLVAANLPPDEGLSRCVALAAQL